MVMKLKVFQSAYLRRISAVCLGTVFIHLPHCSNPIYFVGKSVSFFNAPSVCVVEGPSTADFPPTNTFSHCVYAKIVWIILLRATQEEWSSLCTDKHTKSNMHNISYTLHKNNLTILPLRSHGWLAYTFSWITLFSLAVMGFWAFCLGMQKVTVMRFWTFFLNWCFKESERAFHIC